MVDIKVAQASRPIIFCPFGHVFRDLLYIGKRMFAVQDGKRCKAGGNYFFGPAGLHPTVCQPSLELVAVPSAKVRIRKISEPAVPCGCKHRGASILIDTATEFRLQAAPSRHYKCWTAFLSHPLPCGSCFWF